MATTAFWFRRDLRLEDNIGLNEALKTNNKILAVFIFDREIVDELPSDDPRTNFIYDTLLKLHDRLLKTGSGILIRKGKPIEVWKLLISEYKLESIYTNHDYEPYAIKRDKEITQLCHENNLVFKTYKDQVIFEKGEILKTDNSPYTVFTPYKNKWLSQLTSSHFQTTDSKSLYHKIIKPTSNFPQKKEIGIQPSHIAVKPFNLSVINQYDQYRNFPSKDAGSYLGPHLRFGTISIRRLVETALNQNEIFLSELIWREFFMQILFHFPEVVSRSFKSKYDNIQWINNEKEFDSWCKGKTGYPMVDAGMRELNQTGYMHNRVRMITASFLVKHLLIDWRWGEAYFARKLLDYELSSNNGNWQWAAGTGCDAAPYFRVFNPSKQQKKFDPDFKYIKKWIPEFATHKYTTPIIEHSFARKRVLETYKIAIN